MTSSISNYVTLKIPRELVDKMDYVISKRLCGYRSRAEMASEGIRIILSSIVNNRDTLSYNKERDGNEAHNNKCD